MADRLRIHPAASPPPEEASVSSKTGRPITNRHTPRFYASCRCCRGIMYLVFRFKIPTYSINRLALSAFKVDGNLTVRASFVVTITADNPNAKMGIYYLDGGRLSVLYGDNLLGSGSFPVFYQGHRNTTVINVIVSGEAPLAGPLVTALRRQQRETGTVPLAVHGDVPVRAKVGKLKLWRATAQARCNLLVGAVNPEARIGILSNTCSFKFKLSS
uniref:Late embryogenesis abundant protein LEA-2 subgroup domain-containing protein n=1 Tax=Ananas comosus var. bracteatus TaxID=296719 RepID=A0A6V7QCF1_ANACO|nr:unnamed protein product [Ananas comosus var. bracteatus]